MNKQPIKTLNFTNRQCYRTSLTQSTDGWSPDYKITLLNDKKIVFSIRCVFSLRLLRKACLRFYVKETLKRSVYCINHSNLSLPHFHSAIYCTRKHSSS